MSYEEELRRLLAKQPEQMFSVPTLVYNSAEINSVTEHFRQAESRPSYKAVIELLSATKQFRMDTTSNGPFARRIGDVGGLDHVFNKMDTALKNAAKACEHFAGIDLDIMHSAIRYCHRSIINRVRTRHKDHAFLALWDKSALKKTVKG